jgi:DNA invertase Pin-like site-specific DNA recombinase
MAAIIGYLRVSTKGQGESGLGIEAQKASIEAYARQGGLQVTTFYTEVESGKLADRPELKKALIHARRSKARLVVAKLDRLSRNVAFLSALLESKVDFVAVDNPHANKLTIHLLAAVAEHEAEMISQRTKAALQAYKARGGKLGAELEQCRNLTPDAVARGRERSIVVRGRNATEAYSDLWPLMAELRANGMTLAGIADRLNSEGHVTRRGRPWNPVQVARVLERTNENNS